jgi:hypothetical protein
MKRIFIFLSLAVLTPSCGFIINTVSRPLITEKDCWIDTRTLTFYYNGGEIVEGVSIYLDDDKKSIEFRNDRQDTRILKIELDSLRPVLTRQAVIISVDRANTHWRDYQRIEIEQEDWTKKKRINSIHTHH